MTLSPTLETLAGLIRINSVNPAYPNGKPESGIAAYVRDFFASRGIRTFDQEVFPDRPNVVAVVPGKSSRRIVLEAHVDTAAVDGMTIPPFEPNVSEGRMYGRGACDTKSGLAAMMHAAAAVAKEKPPCEVWMVAAADEEHSYRGVVKLCEGLKADAAIVAEPTSMRAVVATKGCVRWKIICRGKSAHSSKPHLGRSAIVDMARVILALEADAQELEKRRHPLLGPPTLNIGVIRGGVQVNAVPDRCSIEIDRRLLPGEEVPDVLAAYRRLLDSLHVDAVMEPPMLQDFALETPLKSPVVAGAREVLKQLGLEPEPVGVPYGSDASKLSRAGVPSIVVGPGSIDQAHAAVEYVDCEQVDKAFEFYRRFLLWFQ